MLYEIQRNPLLHSLGVQVEHIADWSGVANRQLDGAEVESLEESERRPDWLTQLFMKMSLTAGTNGTFLAIPTFYWGTWRLLSKLCGDRAQMEKAERLAEKLLLHPAFATTLPN